MRKRSVVAPIPGVVVPISSRIRLRNTLSSGSHGRVSLRASQEGCRPYMCTRQITQDSGHVFNDERTKEITENKTAIGSGTHALGLNADPGE